MNAGPILSVIRSLGYRVSVHAMGGGISLSGRELSVPAGGYIEMHAVITSDPPMVHIARVEDEGPDTEYRCACALAEMVGVDLEDG